MILDFVFSFTVFTLIKTVLSRTIISGLSQVAPTLSITGSFSEQMELYQLDWEAGLAGMEYIIFEVILPSADMEDLLNASKLYPMLCYEFNADPSLTYDSVSNSYAPCASGFDYNQYSRASGSYSVEVSTTAAGTYTSLVFGVYIERSIGSYSVKVRGKFSSSSEEICPFNCNVDEAQAKNYCNNRKCKCPARKIDYDCSMDAVQIQENSNVKILTNISKMSYAYYMPLTLAKSTSVNLSFRLIDSKLSAQVYTSSFGQQPLKIVPDKSNYSHQFIVGSKELMYKIDSSLLFNGRNEPQQFIFGFMLSENSIGINEGNLVISVYADSSDSILNSIVIYTLIASSSIIFLILMAIFIAKIRRLINHKSHNMVTPSESDLHQQTRLDKTNQSKQQLSMDFINKYLPEMNYQEIKSQHKGQNFDSDQCSVCLVEFQLIETCRIAICGHVFHKECIEKWLMKQESCPFCRRDLSRNEIVKDHQQTSQKLITFAVCLQESNQVFNLQREGGFELPTTVSAQTSQIIMDANRLDGSEEIQVMMQGEWLTDNKSDLHNPENKMRPMATLRKECSEESIFTLPIINNKSAEETQQDLFPQVLQQTNITKLTK